MRNGNFNGRLDRIHKAMRPEASPGFDMTDGLSARDGDLLAVTEEYLILRESTPEYRLSSNPYRPPTPRENIPEKILGPDYTERELYELAITRGLAERGYSEDEIDDMMPELLVELEDTLEELEDREDGA